MALKMDNATAIILAEVMLEARQVTMDVWGTPIGLVLALARCKESGYLSVRDIAEAKGVAMSEDTVRREVQRLVDRGLVTQINEGRLRLYRANQPPVEDYLNQVWDLHLKLSADLP